MRRATAGYRGSQPDAYFYGLPWLRQSQANIPARNILQLKGPAIHLRTITLPIQQMSQAEKLMALEALWEDLSRNEEAYESPEWHLKELAVTEERVKSGQEQFLDWESAKRQLRQSE